MSIRAMNWAWEQKLSPTPKLILMALADAANDVDECWPGIPFVARKCCVSERTVQRVLQDFDAAKLLSVEAQFDLKNGRRTSNKYHLNIGAQLYPDNLSPASKKVERVGVELSGAGVTGLVTYVGDTAKSPLEPLQESEQQPLHVPSALSKLERQRISSLAREIPMADAQALLDELADALETSTIKTNAMRWFRGLVARYRKGEFAAAGGLRIAARRARVNEALSAGSEIASRPTDQVAAKQALAHIKGLVSTRRAVDVRAGEPSTDTTTGNGL